MPQLQLFNRRWHSSSDTQPLVALLFGLIHVALLVGTIILAAMITSGQYTCDQKHKVAGFIFGVFAIFLLNFILDGLIFTVGLRGGPFEENKRKTVRIFIYMQVFLLVCHVAFAAYGTYLAYSPSVSKSCWSKSPCSSVVDKIPQACVYDNVTSIRGDDDIKLSPACQYVQKETDSVDKCFATWADLGLGVRVMCADVPSVSWLLLFLVSCAVDKYSL